MEPVVDFWFQPDHWPFSHQVSVSCPLPWRFFQDDARNNFCFKPSSLVQNIGFCLIQISSDHFLPSRHQVVQYDGIGNWLPKITNPLSLRALQIEPMTCRPDAVSNLFCMMFTSRLKELNPLFSNDEQATELDCGDDLVGAQATKLRAGRDFATRAIGLFSFFLFLHLPLCHGRALVNSKA